MTRSARPRLSARRATTAGIVAIAALVCGFGSWAVLADISGAVVADGRIEVDRNRQVVQHPDGGVLSEMVVDEGDTVAPGDVLMRLDASQLHSDLAVIEGQLFELMARRGRLEAERDDRTEISFDPELDAVAAERPEIAALLEGQRNLFAARRASLDQQLDQLAKRADQIRSRISGISAQAAALRTQQALIADEARGQQALYDRGLAQVAPLLGLRREAARLGGETGALAAARAEAEEQITEIGIEVLRLESLRREEAIARLRDLRVREVELAEARRTLLARLDRLDIRAPVGGIVHDLKVSAPRAVVRPAEPILHIVPQDRPLVVAARIRPADIDAVFVGQPVTLRFSALDRGDTPELAGTLTHVSADAFEDPQTRTSYFRVEIEIGEEALSRLGGAGRLTPGMPVDAFIRTSARSPLDYLVAPLTDHLARAFREG